MTEVRQFANQGVPLLAQLQKNLGMTALEVRDQMKKGLITFIDVKKAIDDIAESYGSVDTAALQTTTGQLNVDNLRLDGNVLSATSGGITLTPADGQNLSVGGTNTNLIAGEANFTLMEATTARANTIESDTTNADLVFNTQGTGVFDFNAAIKMAEVSKPTAVADHGFIYTKNDSGTGEVFVLDAADNETKISPHNDNGEWEYFSRNKASTIQRCKFS